MVADIAEFLQGRVIELGFPCKHRQLKRYLNEGDCETWLDLHKKYVIFIETKYTKTVNDSLRRSLCMGYKSFIKYIHATQPDFALKKLKEDCYDGKT